MDAEWIKNLAAEIQNKYPIESCSEVENMSPVVWSRESYRLAIEVAYAGIEPDTEPSEKYLQKGFCCAQRQIALAGYRLGKLLEMLFYDISIDD